MCHCCHVCLCAAQSERSHVNRFVSAEHVWPYCGIHAKGGALDFRHFNLDHSQATVFSFSLSLSLPAAQYISEMKKLGITGFPVVTSMEEVGATEEQAEKSGL